MINPLHIRESIIISRSNFPRVVGMALGLVMLGGCASITGSGTQPLSVETRDLNGAEVKRAECKLNNNKGQWYVSTPGTVMVVRSSDDLLVMCEKENFPMGHATVVSSVKGMMFGNIIFGGVVGAVVDHAQGSGYEYPGFISIVMGKRIILKSDKPPVEENAGGTGAAGDNQ
jgi:hypothetical protein